MKKPWKRRIIIIVAAVVVVLTVFGVLFYIEYSDEHEVIRLGQYRDLTVSSSGAESAEDALVTMIVQRTIFGRAMDRKVEEKYEDAMAYFESEAAYFQLALPDYIKKYYATDEKEFRDSVHSTAETTVKQAAVLHAIAEKENIELTNEEFEAMMPSLLETYGYTSEAEMAKAVDLQSVRDELFQEKVIDYLMTQNTVVSSGQ
jgi:FKBP-type peptidyl-prolyl cis-trans isomerase (trigger factor)